MNANKGKENKSLQDGQRNRKRTRNDRRKAKEAAKTAAAAVATANNKKENNNKIAALNAVARASWTSSACTTNAKNVKNAAINNIFNAHQQKVNIGVGVGVKIAHAHSSNNNLHKNEMNGPSISGQQQQQQLQMQKHEPDYADDEPQQEKRPNDNNDDDLTQTPRAILNCEPGAGELNGGPEMTLQMTQFGRQWDDAIGPPQSPTGDKEAASHLSRHDISLSCLQRTTWPNMAWQMPDLTTKRGGCCWPMRSQNHYLDDASTQLLESQIAAKTVEALQSQSQTQTQTPTPTITNDDELSHIQSAHWPLTYTQSPLNLSATTDWLSNFRKLLPLPNSMLHCSQIESELFVQIANLTRSFSPLGVQFSFPRFGGSQCGQNSTVEGPGSSCSNNFAATKYDTQLGSTTQMSSSSSSPSASVSPPPPQPEQFGSQFGSRFGDNVPWELVVQTMPRDLIDEMPSKLLLEMQLPRAPPCDNFVAMDCEMVGIGVDGQINMVARVSIVNQRGQVLLDKYVKPREFITDYRTNVSGIRPNDFLNADDFSAVQSWVQQILHNRILVGHNVATDLKVLNMFHPFSKIRDTSHYKPLAHYVSNGRTPSLKLLSQVVLGVEIQNGEHDSVEDARAAMGVYNRVADYWESSLKRLYACTI